MDAGSFRHPPSLLQRRTPIERLRAKPGNRWTRVSPFGPAAEWTAMALEAAEDHSMRRVEGARSFDAKRKARLFAAIDRAHAEPWHLARDCRDTKRHLLDGGTGGIAHP